MTIREEVESVCRIRLGRSPDLEDPRGYNDKIQWLKIFDQTPEHVTACDKFACRELVAARAGESVLVPLLYEGPRYRRQSVFPHIAKASHDSGSAVRVDNPAQTPLVITRLQKAMGRPYGHGKGEWAYRLIEPRRVLVEECLPGPIVDFKFHCSGGAVRWLQVISERGHKKGPAEAIFDPEGKILPLHFDQNMRHVPNAELIPSDVALAEMTEIAEILAAGWRYVRVDLYWAKDQVFFGELTFWPLAGCYTTKDEPVFGDLLELDRSNPSPPIMP
jgi:TupA-like ATPgrasp